MHYDLRQDLTGLPRAFGETLGKGRPELEALVRETRWGDGPIYMTASGSAFHAVLAGANAFEWFAGWPVVAHPAAHFEAYTVPLLRPRSVLIVVPSSVDNEILWSIVNAAKSRGSIVLALTDKPGDAADHGADGVFLLRPGEEVERGARTGLLQQAALCYIAFLAAAILKRPGQHQETLAEEFANLPGQAEWISNQLRDAAQSLAAELGAAQFCAVVGGGPYYPASLEGAFWLRELAGLAAEGFEVCEFQNVRARRARRDTIALILSSSRSRVKKQVHQAAKALVAAGSKILAITDTNDRELATRAQMAVLLPTASELTGSILTGILLGWVTHYARDAADRQKSKTPNPEQAH